ncbi:MAG TPA: ABC transporter transmembrane domain-containing protein [Gemmataceae bacterium]|nr:ABC transporter transmembrane domain-containing protein [Gemmataceae bacterium]
MGQDGGPTPARQGDGALYRRLLRLARPYAPHLGALLLLELVDGLCVLLRPVPIKLAIDSVVGSRPLPPSLGWVMPRSVSASPGTLLAVALGLLLAVALASALLRGWVSERLLLRFRGVLFGHAQRLSLSYHDAEGTADATYRLQKDAAAVPDLLLDGALPLAAASVTVALMFAVMLRLDWQLGLVAAAVAPVLLFLSGRRKPRLRRQSREVKHLESRALGVVQEVLTALRVVKAFGQEDREQARFQHLSGEGVRARLRLLLAEGGTGSPSAWPPPPGRRPCCSSASATCATARSPSATWCWCSATWRSSTTRSRRSAARSPPRAHLHPHHPPPDSAVGV